MVEIIGATPQLTVLNTLGGAIGLENLLNQTSGNVTLFAPTDEAFAELLRALVLPNVEVLLEEEDPESIASILQNHLLLEAVYSLDLEDGMMVETLLPGSSLEIGIEGEDVTVFPAGGPEAKVIRADIVVS